MALFPRRNLLAYPVGATPGFDPSHVAARSILMTAVASGGSFISLSRAATPTITGSPVAGVDGSLGPVTKLAGTVDVVTFPSWTTLNTSSCTFAAIIKVSTGNPNFGEFISYGSGGQNKSGLQVYLGNQIAFNCAGVTTNIVTNTITREVPYFVIGSNNASAQTMLIKNLLTGAVTTQSFTSLGSHTAGTTATFGLDNSQSGFGGMVAAGMVSAYGLSLPEMLQWADDPWSFWYPNRAPRRQYASLGGASFSPYWANNNLPVIGTGTY